MIDENDTYNNHGESVIPNLYSTKTKRGSHSSTESQLPTNYDKRLAGSPTVPQVWLTKNSVG